MKYWTLKMIAEHTGRNYFTVRDALNRAGVKLIREPGIKGIRVEHPTASRFVAKQWPDAGPLPQ